MLVWEQQLEQMLDQAALYGCDWDECLNMLAELPETEELHEYLTYLIPRMKYMQRQFNWVTVRDGIYFIHNYDYKMYQWFKKRQFKQAVVTSGRLCISKEQLSPDEQEQLRKHLMD